MGKVDNDGYDDNDNNDNYVYNLAHLPSSARARHGMGKVDNDIYIMMKCLSVCLSVTKNDHFLLGVSCNHLNPP